MLYRNLLLVIHIATAGAWLGANVMQGMVPGMLGTTGPAAAKWFRATETLAKRFYMPVGITVLVSGILLVLNSDAFSFGSLFVTIGFAAVIIGGVLGGTVFGPKSAAMAEALESGETEHATSIRATLARFGAFDTLVLLVAIYAMVAKLGA